MRIIFMGSPEFSVPFLEHILEAKHEVIAVFSAPLAIRGRRGNQLEHCAIGKYALEKNLQLFTPKTLRDKKIQQEIINLNPDLIVVVAYGALLPQEILNIPKYGCINVHGSLLPKWRGAAPIERAIEAGDSETGVTIMQMRKTLDTGPIALTESVPIEGLNSGELRDLLAKIGAPLLIQALSLLENGNLNFYEQVGEATYAEKIDKSETRIDWHQPAKVIERKIRAFNPIPGSWCEMKLGNKNKDAKIIRVKILFAEISDTPTILSKKCDDKYIAIKLCQKAGGSLLSDIQFVSGYTSVEIL